MQPAPGVEPGSIDRYGFTLRKCRPDLHVLVDNGQGSNDLFYLIADWGDAVVEKLSRDILRVFPGARGFSAQNLWRMSQFYLAHTTPEFLSHAVTELGIKGFSKKRLQAVTAVGTKTGTGEKLSQAVREFLVTVPWGHHANALAKVTDPGAKFYYVRATARFGWMRDILINFDRCHVNYLI